MEDQQSLDAVDLQDANEALMKEIGQRNLTEKSLRQSEEQFRMLLDGVDGVKDYAIYMLDPDGRVLSWNMGADELLGYEPKELMGKLHACFYSAADRDSGKPESELKRALLNGRSAETGQRMRKDGSLFWTEVVTSSIYDDTRKLRGFAEVLHDITGRKNTQGAIALQMTKLSLRSAELEAVNQELEAFTYSVSHDLRAPLRHISGFSQLLVEDFSAALPPEAQRYLQRIAQGSKKMGILIDELLGLARIGRHALSYQITDVNALVLESVAILANEAEQRIVEWKISDLGLVNCDPVLLGQVFQNLIANSLKFTRPRASAVIEISRLADEVEPTFYVRDNGVGFDMKYAGKLFGVFQRLHRAEDFEGTGIGLATAKRVIQKHGGRVWANAEIGKGASFYFSVPLVTPTDEMAELVIEEYHYEAAGN